MNNRAFSKIWVIIVIIIILFAGGILTWHYLGQNKTTNWKTYKDEAYGFEIKYPEVWGDVKTEKPISGHSKAQAVVTFIEGMVPANPEINPVLYSKEGKKSAIGYVNIAISVYNYDNPNNLSIKEIFKNLNQPGGISWSDLDDPCLMDYKFINLKSRKGIALAAGGPSDFYIDAIKELKTMTVDGKEALRRPLGRACATGASSGDHIYLAYKNQIYRISMTWEPLGNEKPSQWAEVFNQMVSTFKFLK